MPTKIKKHRHAQEQFAGQRTAFTHHIQIGCKVVPGGDRREYPSPLNGFVITRATRVQGGARIVAKSEKAKTVSLASEVDFSLMQALGYSREKVEQGMTLLRSADATMLPQQLEFALLSDVCRDEDGDWDLSPIIVSQFACWFPELTAEDSKAWGRKKGPGLFCKGDGCTASRKQPDGTRKTIKCVPFGSAGAEAKDFCEYSKALKSPCGVGVGMLCFLIRRDATGQVFPLANMHNARFVFETGSAPNLMAIEAELCRAADALDGMIAGVEGTLQFAQELALKPDGAEGESMGLVPRVSIVLNQWQIRAKKDARLAARSLGAESRPRLIAGPVEVVRHEDIAAEDAAAGADEGDDTPSNLIDDRDRQEDSDSPVEVGGAVDELPSGDDGPVEVTAADATVPEMLAAIESLARSMSRENGEPLPAALERATFIKVEKNGKSGTLKVRDLGWFIDKEQTATELERREAILRMICQKHVDDPRFLLVRGAAA